MNVNNIGALEWVPIPHFMGIYEININGSIRSKHKRYFNHIVSQRIDRAGYWVVRLNKNGKTRTLFVHRLLAQIFLVKPEEKCCVNHINGIKTDNRIENLEWVTHGENMKHAYDMNLIKALLGKEREVVDTCTGKKYKSIREASKLLHIAYSTIKNYLNGKRRNMTCLQYAPAP